MPQPIDYNAVLQDLEAKQAQMNAQFDAAKAAIRQVMAIQRPGLQPSLLSLPKVGLPFAAATPPRAGSMVDIAIDLLGKAGRPVPNLELAKLLDLAGFPHKSKNFPNTLNSILHRRANKVGDVRKTGNAWELVRRSE